MSKHTPGPWRTKLYEDVLEVYANVNGPGWLVAQWESPDDNDKANARLIAAAPDLLAACQAIDEWHDLMAQDYPEIMRPFRMVRAAIAKATGG